MNPIILLGIAITGIGILTNKKSETKKEVDTNAKIVPYVNSKPETQIQDSEKSEAESNEKAEANEQKSDNFNNLN